MDKGISIKKRAAKAIIALVTVATIGFILVACADDFRHNNIVVKPENLDNEVIYPRYNLKAAIVATPNMKAKSTVDFWRGNTHHVIQSYPGFVDIVAVKLKHVFKYVKQEEMNSPNLRDYDIVIYPSPITINYGEQYGALGLDIDFKISLQGVVPFKEDEEIFNYSNEKRISPWYLKSEIIAFMDDAVDVLIKDNNLKQYADKANRKDTIASSEPISPSMPSSLSNEKLPPLRTDTYAIVIGGHSQSSVSVSGCEKGL